MLQLTTLNTSENQRILVIRGQHVMIDAQLAGTYNVATKALNQAVKRNLDRFPSDFMFQLSKAERDEVVTNCDHLKQLKYSMSCRVHLSSMAY
jgi:ORF6N domain